MRLLTALALLAIPSEATKIVPRPWQQLVHEAAFVGVVECTAAGAEVAEYVVLESWKGAPEGTHLRIRTPGDYWHSQLPLALVGERFFVTAFDNKPRSVVASTTRGGAVPLTWRSLPAQYTLPLLQGRIRVPRPTASNIAPPSFQHWQEPGNGLLGTGATTWPAFKKKVFDFLTLPAAARERTVAKIHVGGRPSSPEEEGRPSPEAPSEERLAELRRILKGGQGELNWQEAFETLTVHDPSAVAAFLHRWEQSNPHPIDFSRAYAIGSYFGWRCGKDRRANLESLLDAREPFVRVAAAVYLAFDEPSAGEKALRGFATLPGDAGAWAALTLARRGDRSAIPRAMEVLEAEVPEEAITSMPRRNLADQVMVFLSNSALGSGLELPACEIGTCTSRVDSRLEGPHLKEWWRRYGTSLVPADPWRDELERRKID